MRLNVTGPYSRATTCQLPVEWQTISRAFGDTPGGVLFIIASVNSISVRSLSSCIIPSCAMRCVKNSSLGAIIGEAATFCADFAARVSHRSAVMIRRDRQKPAQHAEPLIHKVIPRLRGASRGVFPTLSGKLGTFHAEYPR